MKTLIRLSKFAVLPFLMAAVFAGCGKSDNNNSATRYQYVNNMCVDTQANNQPVSTSYCSTAYGNNGYSYVNGQCVMTSTGQVMPSQYCQYTGGTPNGYTYSNGQCYSTSTGQIVPSTYCTSNTGNGGYTSQTCQGQYIYSNGYQQQIVYCSGYSYTNNCRGYMLYTYPGYQPVYCQ